MQEKCKERIIYLTETIESLKEELSGAQEKDKRRNLYIVAMKEYIKQNNETTRGLQEEIREADKTIGKLT